MKSKRVSNEIIAALVSGLNLYICGVSNDMIAAMVSCFNLYICGWNLKE